MVKMTQSAVSDIAAADGEGLKSAHTKDNYIYLVDKNGNPVNNFKGIHGDKNVGISAPYLVCTVHTKQHWDAYLASQGITPATQQTEETDPLE